MKQLKDLFSLKSFRQNKLGLFCAYTLIYSKSVLMFTVNITCVEREVLNQDVQNVEDQLFKVVSYLVENKIL